MSIHKVLRARVIRPYGKPLGSAGYDPSNGGVSSKEDYILVIHPEGQESAISPSQEFRLFQIDDAYGDTGYHKFVPYNTKKEGFYGPMFGGNLATLDGTGVRDSRIFRIHDRYETPEQCDALSR